MRPLQAAIKKYGADNFDLQVIAEGLSKEETNNLECAWICLLRTNRNRYGKEFGYNLTDGGEGSIGFKHSEEMRASFKGRKLSKERREAISQSQLGRPCSPETRQKMSISRSGERNAWFGKIPPAVEAWILASKERRKELAAEINDMRTAGMSYLQIAYALGRTKGNSGRIKACHLEFFPDPLKGKGDWKTI